MSPKTEKVVSRFYVEEMQKEVNVKDREIANLYRNRCLALEKEVKDLKNKNNRLLGEISRLSRTCADISSVLNTYTFNDDGKWGDIDDL